MSKYPIFLELKDRRVVLIGGGSVAARKAQTLTDAGARLVVIAEDIEDVLAKLCIEKNIELIRSKYSKQYLGRAVLVIAATDKKTVNQQIYKDCQQQEILCNVVDQPELCDFFVPAVVKHGNLQIAVSTEGNCPAYAGHIRKKLQEIFTEEHGRFLEQLEYARKNIIENLEDPTEKKSILGQLVNDNSFEYFMENGPSAWRNYADDIIKNLKV